MKELNMSKNMLNNKGQVIIYKSSKGPELEVRLKEETVWLNQAQIAMLFDAERSVITKHLRNIFKSGELEEKSNVQNLHIAGSDKSVKFYNLDAIISVGYRVNSKRATQFRIWATKTLKSHLVKGYTINEKRLLEQAHQLKDLQAAILFLQKKSQHKLLKDQTQEILDLLSRYAKSLSLLEQYDKNTLHTPKGAKAVFVLSYEHSQEVIKNIKTELLSRKEASDLFGKEVGGKFEGIVKGLCQTFGGKEVYKTIEEKASHLLYLTIKDHPFVDGNKRIASFLFVYFLDKNNYLYKNNSERKINDNALASLALLTAISDPKEKDIMVKLIMNLLS